VKRILLVEAHNIFRQGLAVVVGQEPDLEVVAQAGSLAEARRVLRVLRACDVAVVDLLMPDGDAAQFVWELRSQSTFPHCAVLVLITESLAGEEDHLRARAEGADEVLSKAASLQEIIDALKRLVGT
jgi:DNA-binding NarL/FixJ family response regulator